MLTEAFYWDQNDETRAWSQALLGRRSSKMPTMVQAGVYSAVTHYLKAIKAAGTDDGPKVVAKMREMPINDFMTKNGKLREDGRVMRDMYLFQVKKPAESKYPWDYYKLLATIPGRPGLPPAERKRLPAGEEGDVACRDALLRGRHSRRRADRLRLPSYV